MSSTLFPTSLSWSLESFILPHSYSGAHSSENAEEAKEIASLLKQIISSDHFSSLEQFSKWMQFSLPYITKKSQPFNPYRHTIFLLCSYNKSFKQEEFFEEMIKKSLITGHELSLISFRCFRFYFKNAGAHHLLLVEATVIIHEKKEIEWFNQHFPFFAQNISLGCESPQAAKFTLVNTVQTYKRLLGLSYHQKFSEIEKDLRQLMKRFPHIFEVDLLHEWGCFLTLSSPYFWDLRSCAHLSGIVAALFWMRKKTKEAILHNPEKRHLFFHFFSGHLESPFMKKPVLGIMVTLSLFDKHEHFDEEHLLVAIQKWVPKARLVQGSRYLYRNPQEESLATLYVELDKENDEPFTSKEKNLLRKMLTQELKAHVQKLSSTLYVIENEEQVRKNLNILSQELELVPAFPHIRLSFEKQTDRSLIFTLILVYAHSGTSLDECIKQTTASHIECILERKENLGSLSSGLMKEACVFTIQVAKSNDLLRKDFSVDLYRARQKVYAAVVQAIGNVIDYDGTLIHKQQELIFNLHERFSTLNREKSDLLENFFYSLSPSDKKDSIPFDDLADFFSFVSSTLEDSSPKEDVIFKKHETLSHLYTCIHTKDFSFKKHIQKYLASFSSQGWVCTNFHYKERFGIAFFLESSDPKFRQESLNALKKALHEWQDERKDIQVLRLSIGCSPISLDPRMAGDGESGEILLLLFEGLMRYVPKDTVEYGIAKDVRLSNDLKTYTFHLREAYWSNGTPIHAQDFEFAWKRILSPEFKTSFAHYFYPIKNARAAKFGLVSLDEVGIHSIDSHTLQVDLELPLSYFLELIAEPLFSPIPFHFDKMHPQWPTLEGESFVCNGPFILKKNLPEKHFVLEKNPLYWDASSIPLHQIIISQTTGRVALEMFKKGELDWLGRPLRQWESIFELAKSEGTPVTFHNAQVCWCSLNTRSAYLKCLKLRQALALAVNRQDIVDFIFDGTPAFSPLPPNHAKYPSYGIKEGEPGLARNLFQEALLELKLSSETFPALQMIYPEGEKREKIARILHHQWKKVLGIDIHLQGYPWSVLFQKVTKGHYDLACLGWHSSINDPLYTLNVFKSAEDAMNFPKWEHPEFIELINFALYELEPERRAHYLERAEVFLIKEAPVIPLIYEKEQGLKRKSLKIDMRYDSAHFKGAYFFPQKGEVTCNHGEKS